MITETRLPLADYGAKLHWRSISSRDKKPQKFSCIINACYLVTTRVELATLAFVSEILAPLLFISKEVVMNGCMGTNRSNQLS